MKKVLFTSILLLSAVSFGGNIYAQGAAGGNDTEVTPPSATKPSVTFTADGNTLTISGQGDLTSCTTTDWSAKVFTVNAVGFVFTDADGKTPVAAGDSYNAGKTYYKAKYDYTRLMGIDSINFGSVFLFRNGFRILPFGETGDDSWGIDFRAQQGRARYLGSRDLMGRVDVTVEDVT